MHAKALKRRVRNIQDTSRFFCDGLWFTYFSSILSVPFLLLFS
jgi:hypothetical protein